MDKTTHERLPTVLSQALASPSRKVGPRDVFQRALGRWVRGEAIDIGAIARELGVSRATVFRWVGSRDLLVSEVLWHACSTTWTLALTQARGQGAERAADATYRMMRAILAFAPFSRFLQRDAEYALRLLIGRDSLVQARMVEQVHEQLLTLHQAGELHTQLPLADLAFMMVRIVESCLYSDQIGGRRPNPELVRDTIRILLADPRPS